MQGLKVNLCVRHGHVPLARSTLSVVRRRSSKQRPHFSERRMGLCQLRVSKIDLNIIERGLHVLDLSDRVPTLISLFPAVAIG